MRAQISVLLLFLLGGSSLANQRTCPFSEVAASSHLVAEFEAAVQLASIGLMNPNLKGKQKKAAIEALLRETVRVLEASGYEVEVISSARKDHNVVAIRKDRKKKGFDFFEHMKKRWGVDVIFDPHGSWPKVEEPENNNIYSFDTHASRNTIEIPLDEIRNVVEGQPDYRILLHEAVHAFANRQFQAGVAGLLHGEFYAKKGKSLGNEDYDDYVSLDEMAAYSYDVRKTFRETGNSEEFRGRFNQLRAMHKQLKTLVDQVKGETESAKISLGIGSEGWVRENDDSPVVVTAKFKDFRFVFPVPASELSKVPDSSHQQKRRALKLTEKKVKALGKLLDQLGTEISEIERLGAWHEGTGDRLIFMDFETRNSITMDWEVNP